MRNNWLFAFNIAVFIFAHYLLSIPQMSKVIIEEPFLLEILPRMYIPLIVYLGLFRNPLEGILTIYAILISLSPTTSVALGQLLLNGLLIFLLLQAIKSRVFSPGPIYFATLTSVSSFINSFLWWFYDMTSSQVSVYFPAIHIWLLQSALSLLIAPLLFSLFGKLDLLTKKTPLMESSQKGVPA